MDNRILSKLNNAFLDPMGIINRIKVTGQNIYLRTSLFAAKSIRLEGVMLLNSSMPVITVSETGNVKRSFKIETLASNSDLRGQFLHYSISIQVNNAVMIDGVISKRIDQCPSWKDKEYEAIRLQPFYLRSSQLQNELLKGKGLFERGMHYPGIVTPLGVRNICICDYCKESFTLQHIHAGFSEMQYFYSSDSSKTLLVRYNKLGKIPVQLDKNIDDESLTHIESTLPDEDFKYYNSFRCPHCKKPFIDFKKFKSIRPNEYYANKLINTEFLYLKD